MPTSADTALIQRDRALPALAVLLSPLAFVAELAKWFPEYMGARSHITYLRYKPGQSCLAGYRLELDGVSHYWHAKAYRPDATEKLDKYRDFAIKPWLENSGFVVLPPIGMAIGPFPLDRKLATLMRLADPAKCRSLVQKSTPDKLAWKNPQLETLRYKPERRYVARLFDDTGQQALLKVCTPQDFAKTLSGNQAFHCAEYLRVPTVLGHDADHQLFIGEWMNGQPLDQRVENGFTDLSAAGAALVELHRQRPAGLAQRSRRQEIESLQQTASSLAELCPELHTRLAQLTREIADRLGELPEADHGIHGDLHIEQVLLDGAHVVLIDFDQACYGDPAADIGSFIAQLDCMVVNASLEGAQRQQLVATLLAGYRRAGGELSEQQVALYTAYSLLMRAVEPFRQRWLSWPTQIACVLDRAQAELTVALQPWDSSADALLHDFAMPFAVDALNVDFMQARFARLFDGQKESRCQLTNARLVRHKPERRCLIEYSFNTEPSAGVPHIWLGKIRAKGLDKRSFELQSQLYASGFDERSADGTAVPRPIGMLPELNMWLQEKVPGEVVTDHFNSAAGVGLATRIAEAIHKLHCAFIKSHKTHTISDELAILQRRLAQVAEGHTWQARIIGVLNGCERVAQAMVPSPVCGIHRDFYPDQVLVNNRHLYLLDLDLYCLGDPALDVGNFVAHMMEYGLRTEGDIHFYEAPQQALVARFLSLNPAVTAATVQGYITLSLARHIYLSTLFADRAHCTKPLIEHCEHLLGENLSGNNPVNENLLESRYE